MIASSRTVIRFADLRDIDRQLMPIFLTSTKRDNELFGKNNFDATTRLGSLRLCLRAPSMGHRATPYEDWCRRAVHREILNRYGAEHSRRRPGFCRRYQSNRCILGRRVQIVPYDDQAKADIGVQAARDLITKDKVVAAVGYANTGVALPSSKVFQDAKIP